MELASLYSSFALSPLAWYLVWLPRTYCPSTPNTADPISKYLIPAPCMALFAHAPSNLSPRCKVHCSFSFPYIVLPDTSIPIFIHVGIGAFTFFFPSTIPSPSYPIDDVHDSQNTFIYLPWMMVQIACLDKEFQNYGQGFSTGVCIILFTHTSIYIYRGLSLLEMKQILIQQFGWHPTALVHGRVSKRTLLQTSYHNVWHLISKIYTKSHAQLAVFAELLIQYIDIPWGVKTSS